MAASESRRLRRVIKEYVRRAEIANPQIKEARAKLINEFYGKDLTKDNPPNYQPEPWRGSIAKMRETVLTQLGAKPFSLGVNPHGMQLDVIVKDPEGKKADREDRIRFYDDGTAWSTNQTRGLFYKSTKSNKIEIYTDASARDSGNKEAYFTGDITRVGNNAIYNILNHTEEEKPLTAAEKASDWGHTILDWVGFVPGIGDIADVVNAVWYFADGETLEGFLSLIAVIPLLGSAVKASVKGALAVASRGVKGFNRLLRNSLRTGDTYTLWARIVDSGKLSKADLADLGTGLESLRSVFRKSTDALREIPGGGRVADQLDNFSVWLTDSTKQIGELSKVSADAAKRAVDAGTTVNRTITKGVDTGIAGARKVLSIIPGAKAEGLFKRIKNLGWFPEKKLLAIAKGMERRFVRNMAHPTKLTALLKTTPNPGSLMNRMIRDVNGFEEMVRRTMPNLWETVPVSTITDPITGITRQIGGGQVLRANLDDIILNERNARQFQDLFREASQNPGVWREVTDDVARHAMTNDSPVWNLYKTDALKSLATTLDYRYMKGFWDTGFNKNVDIIYNELQDMGEDITKDEIRDNPTGVVYPIIKSGLNQVLPGKTVKDIQTFRDKVAQNPLMKAGLATVGYSVKDDGQIIKTKDLDYNPFGEAGGRFD